MKSSVYLWKHFLTRFCFRISTVHFCFQEFAFSCWTSTVGLKRKDWSNAFHLFLYLHSISFILCIWIQKSLTLICRYIKNIDSNVYSVSKVKKVVWMGWRQNKGFLKLISTLYLIRNLKSSRIPQSKDFLVLFYSGSCLTLKSLSKIIKWRLSFI